MSLYHVDHVSQSIQHEAWEHNSDYAPTPGYYVSPDPTLSVLSPSRSCILENSFDPKSKRGPHPLRFLPLHEWEEGRAYDEEPLTYIYYRIEWRVIVNNREVLMDTKEDVVLAPSAFWQLLLEMKLEKALRRKTARHRRVISDDTVIVASTSDRTKCKLTKRFDDTDITWTAIEK